MRRGGHRGRTDIAGSKVLSAAITPGRKCTDGFEPSRAVLQTAMITRSCARMDSVRVERTPAVLQTAAAPSQLTVRITPAGLEPALPD